MAGRRTGHEVPTLVRAGDKRIVVVVVIVIVIVAAATAAAAAVAVAVAAAFTDPRAAFSTQEPFGASTCC